jgi:hypothetical protein
MVQIENEEIDEAEKVLPERELYQYGYRGWGCTSPSHENNKKNELNNGERRG